MNRSLAVALSLCAALAVAADPKLKGSKKESAPKLDLGLPTFNEIPKDTKLESARGKKDDVQHAPSGGGPNEGYTVVRVVHGKGFIKGTEGAKPSAPFPQVTVAGNPLMTEKFSSVVRVKSPAKRSTSIEVVVLDPRGDTVMEANGQLVFRGGEETEWQVDWEPTGVRNPGEFQVLVRIGGNPLGTFPLKLAAAPAPAQ